MSTYPPTYPTTRLPACLPTYLQTYIPTYLSACLSTYPPTYLLTHTHTHTHTHIYIFRGDTAQIGPKTPHGWGFQTLYNSSHKTRQDSSEGVRSLSQRPLTTQNKTNTRERKSMPSPGFEPVTPANERQQTHALDCTTTGIGDPHMYLSYRTSWHRLRDRVSAAFIAVDLLIF